MAFSSPLSREQPQMLALSATRRVIVTYPNGICARASLAIVKTVRRFQAKVRGFPLPLLAPKRATTLNGSALFSVCQNGSEVRAAIRRRVSDGGNSGG
jgi:hypothetical protein